MATIAILGTLDSKGAEHEFIAEMIRDRGHVPLLIDVGTGDKPTVAPHVAREDVALAAGVDLAAVISRRDRGEAVAAMSRAAPMLVAELHREGRIDAIISLGGGGGTAIATAAMRALPVGFPKLMVSTLASGNTAHYLGTSDILMMPSIVDIAGLNRLSRIIFSRAAGAICGMVEARMDVASDKPMIVASMFGNTTACVGEARRILEESGYEVLVFAATGTGGRAMESIIASGMVAGVLDITTTELADELAGGVLSAGPDRMNAAARAGVPAVIAPGCLDMVNFGEPASVPEKYSNRLFYHHNPQVTLMRTNAEECSRLGGLLAGKVNEYQAPATILLPKCGISVISAAGQPFHDATADDALFEAIKKASRHPVREIDLEINSPEFARECAQELIRLIDSTKDQTHTKPTTHTQSNHG